MGFLIGLILAAKGLVFFSGNLSGEQSRAAITPPKIILGADLVRVSCSLQDAFSNDLKKLAESGTEILLYINLDLKDAGTRKNIRSVMAENSLVYNLVSKQFCVSQNRGADTLKYAALDSALSALGRFKEIPLISTSQIRPERSYYVEMFSVLGKVKVPALQNKEIDLMYFWSFKRPTARTEMIPGNQFLKVKKG